MTICISTCWDKLLENSFVEKVLSDLACSGSPLVDLHAGSRTHITGL